ncbi:OLC1v1019240C1 [Oldenlandia corymbosa var. corymbosa]|uniref:OLC1v1019240C1 n=1 Tax=Oldenlandia corymbosa var. corymbosa TaxID=529605 RepID=A0AAV1EDE8_OLDCO|nr:OLC1v1019240C1 [Oldenlandia corymbosa var. corymbosa]
MHIKRLCFVLPTDVDEHEAIDHEKLKQKAHKHSSCGTQVKIFIQKSLYNFLDSKWFHCCQQKKVTDEQFSGILQFHDTEGMKLSSSSTEEVGSANPRIFSYSELYIGSRGFSKEELLGSGGFGRVYKAVLPSDGTVVAVKCLAEKGDRFEKTFAAELVAVAHLRHRNLVRLRGWLVETTKIGGTIGYLPPESFQKRSFATAKSDVFSFGIVVLEVVSGRRAVDLTLPDDQIILLDWIRKLSDEGMLLQAGDSRLSDGSYNLSDMENMIHVGLLCTLHDPKSRPNMKWAVDVLSGNFYGKLPSLPSFKSHPLYITLSSSPSNFSSSYTITTTKSTTTQSSTSVSNAALNSSNFVTATGETMYVTAEFENSIVVSSHKSYMRQSSFPVVETPRVITYKEIISATNNFADSRRVAEVDFGTAYLGLLEDHHHVLVKRLGMKTCPALRLRFSNELQNLGRLRHRNLVQLRGWCTEQGEMLVVYDYSASCVLSHVLFHHKKTSMKWHHRYSIIRSLASAVHYLHEEWDEQVIHRSITSSAVVLEEDMNPRLGCFALAEFLARNEHGHHVVVDKKRSTCGIFGYMSPEYVESGEATTKSDVYSFGVVLLEVVTGQMAVDFRYPEVLLVRKVHEVEEQGRSYEDLVDWRLDGKYNPRELKRLIKLGIACTSSNPESRPSMKQIVSILDGYDQWLIQNVQKQEDRHEWKQSNSTSLSLIRRIQALGIQ